MSDGVLLGMISWTHCLVKDIKFYPVAKLFASTG